MGSTLRSWFILKKNKIIRLNLKISKIKILKKNRNLKAIIKEYYKIYIYCWK
jgi:hypothetical protein